MDNFGSYLPESDVFHALNEAKIIFNSIELGMEVNGSRTPSQLAEVAMQTGGLYTTLWKDGNPENSLGYVTNFLRAVLDDNSFHIDLQSHFRTVIIQFIVHCNMKPRRIFITNFSSFVDP